EDGYNFISIKCRRSLGLLTLNGLTAATRVLIPDQAEYSALEGLSQLLNRIRLVRKPLNRHLTIEGVLRTIFDARTNLGMQAVEEVKVYFQEKVYRGIIPGNVRLGEAPSHGKPITVYDPRSKGAEVYLELAKEVLGVGEKV